MAALKVWDGTQWIYAGGPGAASYGTTAPSVPSVGQMWADTNTGIILKIYKGAAWGSVQAIPFTVVPPSSPDQGQPWLGFGDSILRFWSGTGWVLTTGESVDWITSNPTAPTTGVIPFTRTRARRLPAFIGPTGQDTRLQPSLAFNTVTSVIAVNNSTTPDLTAIAVTHLNNATATPTAVAVAPTNLFTSLTRYRCATTTTAGTGAGTRAAAAQWLMSATFNKGGLHFVCRFGFNLIAAGSRAFVGMSTTTTALNPAVDPSTLLNQFGFGFDAADANLQFMRKDGTTAVKVDTGMAKGTGGTDFYEAELFVPSGGGASVWYCIRRLTDDTIFRGAAAVTTNIPAVDTLMAWHVHLSNGAVAAAHSVDIKTVYCEVDV